MAPVAQHLPDQHALVIGGSMAGLLAARVLADHYTRVTLIERDRFSEHPEARPGLPQSPHIHVLLASGRRVLERLLPNLIADLVKAGAEDYDGIADMKWISPGGLCPRFESTIRMLGATRNLIDWAVRRQLDRERIQLRTGIAVTGFTWDSTGKRVTGVTTADESVGEISADLVVDASGRGSRTPKWLEGRGFSRPTEKVVNGFLGYSSRIVRRPETWAGDWKVFYIQCAPPHRKRGGAIASVEKGKWVVTLAGGGKDYPPTKEADFRDFARSLPDASFAEAYEAADPLTDITGTKSTENRLRQYEAMRSRPEGLIVTGDAVCAFNPVYGQGMSAAAVAADILDQCLRRKPSLAKLATQFQSQLAKANTRPWLLATGEDYRYREVEGPAPHAFTSLSHRYLNRVTALAARTPSLHKKMVEVLHLLRSPVSLFHPTVAARVLLSRSRLTDRPPT